MKLAQIAKMMNEKGAKAYWIGPNEDTGQQWHMFGTAECLIGSPVLTDEIRTMLAKVGFYEPDMRKLYGQVEKGGVPNCSSFDKEMRSADAFQTIDKTMMLMQIENNKKPVTLRMLHSDKSGLKFVDEKFIEMLEPRLLESADGARDPIIFHLENGMRAVVMPFRVQPNHVILQDAKYYMREWTK